jgi:carbamoyl-phosphate synthase small subunit
MRKSLDEYMRDHGIVGVQEIDTRSLVRHIRDTGAKQGVLATGNVDEDALIAEAKARPSLEGQDLATRVSTRERYAWRSGTWDLVAGYREGSGDGPLVAAFDFGMKLNILRNLAALGCRVVVVPANSSAEDIRALGPDGVFLSNGPGDPDAVVGAIPVVGELIREYPTFGICLGHQILALAVGARTYKMKFGHRGGNQPVIDVDTGVVEITSQNHGFAVDADTVPQDMRVTRINLNDQTVEGLDHKTLPVFSVQYHPEASPGPHDANPLFKKFYDMMRTRAPAGREGKIAMRELAGFEARRA